MASNFNSVIELYTGTDSNTFTDANKLIYANYVYRNILNEINDVDSSRYNRTAHADFTASQSNFSLPVTSGVQDAISGQVLSIWVKYESGGNWYKVEFYPKSAIDLNKTYSEVSPVGWWEKNNFYILPQTDTTISGGIKIDYSLRPSDFSAITDEPDFDKEYWGLIPLGVSYRYLRAQGDYALADRYQQEYNQMLQLMRQKLHARTDMNMRFVPYFEDYS